MEQVGNMLTTKDCDITAITMQAGKYTKSWDAYCVVQHLFKEEVDELDENSRDKKNKSSFGAHTKALREWWNTLSKEEKDEAEAAAKKWNENGANRLRQSM